MSTILAFLKRRWWLTQERLFSTLILVGLTPVLIYLVIHLPLQTIIVRSVRSIPYADWVLPGYLMIISFLGLIPTIYRDLFDLRIHGKALFPMTLTPSTKTEIILGVLVTAVVESLIYVSVGFIVFVALMDVSYRWFDFVFILIYLIIYLFLAGNIFILISLLTSRVTTYIPIILLVVFLYIFSSGMLIEFEFYPTEIGLFLRNLPTSMILDNLRTILFTRYFVWWSILVPMVTGGILVFLNGKLLKHVLKQ